MIREARQEKELSKVESLYTPGEKLVRGATDCLSAIEDMIESGEV